MNRTLNILLVVVALLTITGCSKNELMPKEYLAYVRNPDNGYVKTANNAGVKMECIYKPVDYEIVNMIRRDNITTTEYASLKDELNGNTYYEILIYHPKTPDEKLADYINYRLENDLFLVNGKDSITPNSYLVEPYNGVAPYQRVLFSFKLKSEPNEYSIVINSSAENSMFKAHFLYTTSDIKEVALKLKD